MKILNLYACLKQKPIKQNKMEKLIKCIEIKKDYFMLIIREINLGEFEKSELREIIEKIDNEI